MSTLVAILEFVVIVGPIILGAVVGRGNTAITLIVMIGSWLLIAAIAGAYAKHDGAKIKEYGRQNAERKRTEMNALAEAIARDMDYENNWETNGYYFMGDRFFGLKHFAEKLDKIVKPELLHGMVHDGTFDELMLLPWLGVVERKILELNERTPGQHVFKLPGTVTKDGKVHQILYELEALTQNTYKISFKEAA